MKDREPPTVSINLPTNGYEFRAFKKISISSDDDKGIKDVTYKIDEEVYHVENNSSSPLSDVWNPCQLEPGRHTLQVEVSDFAKHTTISDVVTFYISADLTEDCAGTCDGKAEIDKCGVCSGGESNHEFNSDIDCTDTCFGGAVVDDCDICSGGKTGVIKNRDKDCSGLCFGNAIVDDCGNCEGTCIMTDTTYFGLDVSDFIICSESENNIVEAGCDGLCGSPYIADECGNCSGDCSYINPETEEPYEDGLMVCSENAGIVNSLSNSFYVDFLSMCSVYDTNIPCNTLFETAINSDWIQTPDCAGECGGVAVNDECGVCNGDNTSCTDCMGMANGDSWLSDCGCVVVDNSGDDCDDCAGTPDGDAVIDECGVCDATYETQPAFPYGVCDCNGFPNGEASIDGCGDCVGGDTGLTACANDCLGELGGDAVYDNCGEECVAVDPEADCSEHCDNNPENDCVQDCANDWGGSKEEDVCGVCGGTGIPFGECDCDGNVEDCNGDCGGSAVEDECGVCDTDASNDNTPLTGNCDCNGTPNGEAFPDGCGDCVGGSTGLDACPTDCAGVDGGTSVFDECGICVSAADVSCVQGCDGNWENDGSQLVNDLCNVCGGENACLDCAGTPNGDAVEDECDTCDDDSENDCVQDCEGVWGGSAEIDICGICEGNNDCEGVDCTNNPSEYCQDLSVLQILIDNSLETINMDMDDNGDGVIEPLELGIQTWIYGRLTKLNVKDAQLSGAIPPEIGNLTAVNTLWLNHNQLSGEIPAEIGNMMDLSFLHLDKAKA